MTPRPASIRSRAVCMTAEDWSQFSEALHERFPQARYFLDPRYGECAGAVPPEIPLGDTLFSLYPGATGHSGKLIIMYFDPQWTYEWERSKLDNRWDIRWPPYPIVRINTGRGILFQDGLPPRVGDGETDFYRRPGNKDDETLSRAFFRVLGKFVTNRDQVSVDYPSYAIRDHQPRGSERWCGYDALRWVRESPDRVLFYTGRFHYGGTGVRPADSVG